MRAAAEWFAIMAAVTGILAITFDLIDRRREQRDARHLAALADRLGSPERAIDAQAALERLRSRERV